ncbi:hypothetical protein ACDW39_13315
MKEENFINVEYEDKRFSINSKEVLYIEKQEYEVKIYTESVWEIIIKCLN